MQRYKDFLELQKKIHTADAVWIKYVAIVIVCHFLAQKQLPGRRRSVRILLSWACEGRG